MKITNTPTDHLKKTVMDAVVKAYKLAGYNVPPARDLAEIVNLTCENLRKYFRNNLTDDIPVAFEKGALGDYGENNGLSVARFHQWMRSFNGTGTNQQPSDDDEQAHTQQPPRNRVKDAHDMINSAYFEWLRRGYNLIPAAIILKWLIQDDKIPELRKKVEMAKQQASASLNARYFNNREPFQSIADFIKKNQAAEADAIVLEAFFNECKERGVTQLYND